jgi:hypothetical protein
MRTTRRPCRWGGMRRGLLSCSAEIM